MGRLTGIHALVASQYLWGGNYPIGGSSAIADGNDYTPYRGVKLGFASGTTGIVNVSAGFPGTKEWVQYASTPFGIDTVGGCTGC